MQNDQQKKYRTKSKDAIMTYLEMHTEHSFSAYDVNAYMQEKGIQVNLTTIYRNLDKLTESGEVLKYKTAEDECCRYQCAKPHTAMNIFICSAGRAERFSIWNVSLWKRLSGICMTITDLRWNVRVLC